LFFPLTSAESKRNNEDASRSFLDIPVLHITEQASGNNRFAPFSPFESA
jgi:hypothetical protein